MHGGSSVGVAWLGVAAGTPVPRSDDEGHERTNA